MENRTYEQRLREMIHLLESVEGDDPMVVLCQQALIALQFGAECYCEAINDKGAYKEHGIDEHLTLLGLKPQN